jgi:hypothetical protein
MELAVRVSLCLLLGLVMASGCAQPQVGKSVAPANVALDSNEPDYITVQHVLIGFSGSVPGKPISRTKDEAQKLASELLGKANAGEDFDELVAAHTDDSPPGIYQMANFGKDGDMTSRIQSKWVYERDGMVPAFGNVGFKLEVGKVGMSEFSEDASPFGWHIIRRLK